MRAPHALALLVALATLSIAPAAAQTPLRPPTAEERAILTTYVNVLHAILDQIPDENWVENPHHRYDIDDQVEVSNDPDVPLDVNESMSREYIIRSGSPLEARRTKELEPLMEKFKANPTDPAVYVALQKADKPTHITVEVHFNRLGNPLDSPANLKIPGPVAAFKSTDAHGEESVLLLYGNWKPGSRFRFRRPGRYPAIENIVITMTGDPDRIDHLLQTVDWKSVNTALTNQPPSTQ